MQDDDRQLRAQLQVDAARLDQLSTAPAGLSAIRPAMRRIRMRRIAASGASAALVLLGGAAAVQAIRGSTPDSIVVESPSPVATSELTQPVPPPSMRPAADPHQQPSVTVVADDGGARSPAPSPDAPRRDGSGDSEKSTDPFVIPSGSTPETVTTTTPPNATEPAFEPNDSNDDHPPLVSPDGGSESDESSDGASDGDNTAQPASPPASSVLVADSACGSVEVDMATSPPTIVSVTPVAGFAYRVEDPEPHRIVVQFSGPGEDCEVKVPAGSDD